MQNVYFDVQMRVRGGGCPSWFQDPECLAPNAARFLIDASQAPLLLYLAENAPEDNVGLILLLL